MLHAGGSLDQVTAAAAVHTCRVLWISPLPPTSRLSQLPLVNEQRFTWISAVIASGSLCFRTAENQPIVTLVSWAASSSL
jgi:hypothetical protein